MEHWRIQALEVFPEFKDTIHEAETPYMLWIDLRLAFEDAYRGENRSLIKRIYDFHRWCCEQPRGKTAKDDLLTCVAVCFIEHIPQIPKAVEEISNWFTREEVEGMREILSYHVGQEAYEKVLSQFPRSRRKR